MKAVAALAAILLSVPALAEPRPIGDAEREAVAAAAAFLAQGPGALWSRLSPDAPLRRLAKEDAVRELNVRTGPREGATWTLQTSDRAGDAAFHVTWTSGYDDGLLFRMKSSGNAWTVHEVLTLAEGERPPPPAPKPRPPIKMPLVAAVIGLLLLGIGIRGRSPVIAAALLIGSMAIGAVIALPFLPRKQEVPLPFTELRELERFRTTLARGGEAKVPQEVTGAAKDVATLWLLQSGVAVQVAGTPADPIAGLASVTRTPLAEIVRARIALGNANIDEAARAFERAAVLPPVRDDVLHEAAFSFGDDRGDAFAARMRALGSRDAETYYRQAMRAASRKELDEAQRAFRIAWTLEPKPREDLVRHADLFSLLDNLATRSMISFYSASEPLQRSATLATKPIAWPAGTSAVASGELLQVTIGPSSLEIPNGAALAPPNVRVVPATHGEAARDAVALRDAQEMLEDRVDAPSRTRVVRAAAALARHNRWKDVLTLTNDVTPRAASVAPALLVLRMRGLLRARLHDDARKLAEGQGVRQLASRNDDPGSIVAIAEAMGNIGEWDAAERLYRSVQSEKHEDLIAVRLKQIELRRIMATNSQTLATQHFDIRYDATINPAIASRIGDLLEAELARLQQKLPRVELRRIVVNVLRWEDFRGGITMSDHILGLYDGEILFPFAAVEQFKPEIVSIITHELAHALIAQATSDNAPRWFQEGVAQRMELVPRQENVFSQTPPGVVLPLTLLDGVMEKNADPAAYVVAQTFIRFLEDRFGPNAINQLTSEFARGTSTDDALIKLAGKSLDALNADFRQWGFHNNGDFMMDEPWPYRHLYSPDVDPRIKAGFRFGEQP